MTKRLLIATLLCLSSAVAGYAQNGGCVTIAVGSLEKNRGAFDTAFSATQVLDLDLWLLFTPGAAKRFANDHLVEFRVYTPAGNLYQSTKFMFSDNAARKGRHTRISGYPDAVTVQGLSEVTYRNGKHVGLKMRLPVAGTHIVTSSLYGKWKAQAYVDGETIPCSPPTEFTITQ